MSHSKSGAQGNKGGGKGNNFKGFNQYKGDRPKCNLCGNFGHTAENCKAPARGSGAEGGGGGGGGGGGVPGVQLKESGKAGKFMANFDVYRTPSRVIPQPSREITDLEQSCSVELPAATQPRLDFLKEKGSPRPLPGRPGFGSQGGKTVLFTNYFELKTNQTDTLYLYNICIEPAGFAKEDAAGKKTTVALKGKQVAQETTATKSQSGKKPTGRRLEWIVDYLLFHHGKFASFQGGIVTDFKSFFISKTDLTGRDLLDFVFTYHTPELKIPDRAPSYRVKIDKVDTLDLAALMEYMDPTKYGTLSTMEMAPKKAIILQAFNIFFRYHAKTSQTTVPVGGLTRGNKTFALSATGKELDEFTPGTLFSLEGFFSSVRIATNRLLVNVNTSQGAFYRPGALTAVMDTWLHIHKQTPLQAACNLEGENRRNTFGALESFIKKLQVNLTHLPHRKDENQGTAPVISTIFELARSHSDWREETSPIVDGIFPGLADVHFFLNETTDGSAAESSNQGAESISLGNTTKGRISVLKYFQEKYPNERKKFDSFNRQLPPVNVVFPSKITNDQTSRMKDHAARPPYENARLITQVGHQMVGLTNTNPRMKTYGMSSPNELITVTGRVLPPPAVIYQDAGRIVELREGIWNLAQNKFASTSHLRRWSWLNIYDKFHKNINTASRWIDGFRNALKNVGVTSDDPIKPYEHHKAQRPEIEEFIKASKTAMEFNLSFLLIILPTTDQPFYNWIKKIADVEVGIHTVCVTNQKFFQVGGNLITSKGHKGPSTSYNGTENSSATQYYANIAMKVNLKLGGTNHRLGEAEMSLLNPSRTMVIGIDVTHPSPGSLENAPSIAAMAANKNDELSQWPVDIQINRTDLKKKSKEMVTELGRMLQSRLKLWHREHGKVRYPDNLLIYRDGVAEDQFDDVLHQELPLLRSAAATMYYATKTKEGIPRITLVVCGKRHHTRFYPSKKEDAAFRPGNANARCGTVIDSGITQVRNWDFYLQSHTPIFGTARSAHYTVLLNEIFTKSLVRDPFRNVADIIEAVTYNLCYLWGRSTKPVSYCPPAFYTDRACDRARRWVHQALSPSDPAQTFNVEERHVTIQRDLEESMFYI